MSDDQEEELYRVLDAVRFADRYYEMCKAHPKAGPPIPLDVQTAALAETGRTFEYDAGEQFFAWRASDAPNGCELGVNLSLKRGDAEWVLVFKTPAAGHLGEPFARMARLQVQRTDPQFKPEVLRGFPGVADEAGLRAVIAQGLALVDDVRAGIAKVAWT